MLQTAVAPWLWILGLGWLLLAGAAVRFRALGVAFLTVLVVLIVTGGKPYYLAAAYTAPLAAGAVALEALTAQRVRWLRPVLVVTLVVGRPDALAPRPADAAGGRLRALRGRSRHRAGTEERKELGRLPQFYADMHGWHDMAETVAGVVRALPDEDRAKACVFGQNYGEAGAMEYFGPALGLPPAVSAHNSYWLWGPGTCSGEVMIVIGDDRERLEELFEAVEPGAGLHLPRLHALRERSDDLGGPAPADDRSGAVGGDPPLHLTIAAVVSLRACASPSGESPWARSASSSGNPTVPSIGPVCITARAPLAHA